MLRQLDIDGRTEEEMLYMISKYNKIFSFEVGMVISWYAIHVLSSTEGGLEFTKKVVVFILISEIA